MSVTPTAAQAALVDAVNGCLAAGLDPQLAVVEALNEQGGSGGASKLGQGNATAQAAMTAAVETILANGMDLNVAMVKAAATIGGSDKGWVSLTPFQQALLHDPLAVS